MSESEVPEFDKAEDVPPEGLHALEDEPEDPEEYEPAEPRSPETGTIYDPFGGEAETTPHDVELAGSEDGEE